MFEVQAVIARTYAVSNRGRHAKDGFDLCSTTHCQLYEPARLRTSRWAAVARAAVQRTAGEVLWFADGPRSRSSTPTAAATPAAPRRSGAASRRPISPAPTDNGPAGSAHIDWTFETAHRRRCARALNADPRTAVGAKLDRIEIAGRDAAGRAEKILLRGTRTFVVRGEVFREVVTRALGVKTLRSTLFTVKKSGRRVHLLGKRLRPRRRPLPGRRAGAAQGRRSPDDVLEHYFPGTSLHR